MSLLTSYRLRLRRKRYQARAFRKRRALHPQSNRTGAISPGDVLLFSTIRNEHVRLPYFLKYYRELGIDHFIFVDNASEDETAAFLSEQPDCSVFQTSASYKNARFGVDWMNWLLRKYAHGHWTLSVDVDEFFIYPFCDTRPIRALTDWLDSSSVQAFGTMILDMYPKGPVSEAKYRMGNDPFQVAPWFDGGNYTIERNSLYGNLWIQGGPRSRVYFRENPEQAPALNKVPLVKWNRRMAYVSSTHMLLPRGLNLVYDRDGGEKTSGCLLHAKFLDLLVEKSVEEMQRNQHYSESREYITYRQGIGEGRDLWCEWSECFINWRQLELLGLMSKGNWA